MKIKREVYDRFYKIFQALYMRTYFPKRHSWHDHCSSITSEKHWEVEIDIFFENDAKKRRQLVPFLTKREHRYFYRFLSDYSYKKLSVQDMPDFIVINALRWSGVFLSQSFIDYHQLEEDTVAKIMFQFFWEHHDSNILLDHPSLLVLDLPKDKSSYNAETALVRTIMQPMLKTSEEQEMDKYGDSDLGNVSVRTLAEERIKVNVRRKAKHRKHEIDNSNLDDIKEDLVETISDYFTQLKLRKFEPALFYWSPEQQKSRWSNNFHKFSKQFSSIQFLCNPTIVSSEIMKIKYESETLESITEGTQYLGLAIVFFEEVDFQDPPYVSFKLQKVICKYNHGWYLERVQNIALNKRHLVSDISNFDFAT